MVAFYPFADPSCPLKLARSKKKGTLIRIGLLGHLEAELAQIADARERWHWQSVRRLFQKYHGAELPVFHAVLHAAFSCGQYNEGAAVCERLCKLDVSQDGAAYATALKIFCQAGCRFARPRSWTR